MYFDSKAEDWDLDPKKTIRAEAFAKEISNFLQVGKNRTALEFGCGTGLLSFKLKDLFDSITLADNSGGMIKVLKEKIAHTGIQNFVPLQADLFEEISKFPTVDIVYTLMTLHHMFDMDKTIEALGSITATEGYLCIGDLVKEDGSFHADPEDVYGYNGFDKDELIAVMEKHDFEIEYYSECFNIEKEVEGEMRNYPLFLIIGKKMSQ